MKASNIYPKVLVIPVILSLFLIAFGSVSHAATISGMVYKSDGSTLVNDATIQVKVVSGDSCGWWQYVTHINTSNGSYTTPDLDPGTYYLITDNLNASSYVDEWWAEPVSFPFPDCGNAQSITVESTDITGKNFQLDIGYDVSGTVFESDGSTPVTNHWVQLILGDSCEMWTAPKGVATHSVNGTYTFRGVPNGYYYLRTDNQNASDYVNEWWTGDTDPSSYYCHDAVKIQVNGVDVSVKNFELADGGTVQGILYQSNGTSHVTDEIGVEAYMGESCEDGRQWIYHKWSNPADGTYSMRGLPPENVYLKASQGPYAPEWYKGTEGTYKCSEAEAVTVIAGGTVTGKNFKLDTGGSLAGVVVDKNNSPQQDIQVECGNNAVRDWKSTLTAANGNFTFTHLAPGMFELSIQPEVNTGFVWYERYDCLGQNENKNMGTITLQNGALVSGYFKNASSNPLQYFHYWYAGEKFEIGYGETDNAGYFAFRLPVGNFTLNPEDDVYSAMPVEINVTDVGTPVDLGAITGYDSSTGEEISGSVTDGPSHTGQLEVVAFLDTQDFSPENAGAVNPLAFGEIDVSGNYSLYVVPQDQRSGTLVDVSLILFYEDSNGLETMTVVDTITGITTTGTPVTGQKLTYALEGYTVSGFVKDHDGGLAGADVLLYKQPGDIFAGFAETGCGGSYTFYNVPAGTYRVAANHPDYPDDTKWSNAFEVNANVTVPDIKMRKTMAMPWVYLLLLFD